MSFTISVSDSVCTSRVNEPIFFEVPADLPGPLRWMTAADGTRLLAQRLNCGGNTGMTRFVVVVSLTGRLKLTLGEEVAAGDVPIGITRLEGRERDCFARLDTGAFDLELCSGMAEGIGSSKWGLRHFRGAADGFELLPSGNNAIGGFYGPFFTPENGLINPPEHCVVSIEVLEEGPLHHHYRMHGKIPDGLLPELRGKSFTIDWKFFRAVPWFQRRYMIDDFQTIINGRSVKNKITVGDEFEGGPGNLVFNRFATDGGTRYRAGDPYAGLLVDMVAQTIAQSGEQNEKFTEFRARLNDMKSAHWDLYWRLFCVWEKALGKAEIRERLGRVCAAAHVAADGPERPWIISDNAIDISTVPDETIFSGAASKTVEYDEASGRAMIWWTSKPSGAFQIVQRRESGWVNWGSNGENECPELPVGVDIKTAYGLFANNWRTIADGLETPPSVFVSEV
jgi:hypothetical protein